MVTDGFADELAALRERFESGELKAYGTHQSTILRQFEEIRQAQVELSMKQIGMLGTVVQKPDAKSRKSTKDGKQQEAEDADFASSTDISQSIKAKESSLDALAESMDSICGQIEKVNKLIRNVP